MVQRTSEKISEMDAIASVSAELSLPVTQGPASYRITKQQFLGGVYDVRLYGAVAGDATLATANTTAIQAAIDAASLAAGTVQIPVGEFYTRTLSLKSNCRLLGGSGCKLTLASSVNGPVVSIPASASRVSVEGVDINGSKATNTGGHGITVAASATNVQILNNYIHDCSADGVRFTSASNSIASGNLLKNNAAQGLTGDSLSYFTWVNNIAEGNGFHGIGMIGPCSYGTIGSNVCLGNGSTSPFADQITGYNSGNHHVAITGNVCYGGGNNGMHIGGDYVSIVGNVVESPTQYGIVHFNHDLAVCVGVVIQGNTIKGCPKSGIWLDHVEDSVVSGNSIRTSTEHGIYLATDCMNVAITGNMVRGSVGGGIRVITCNAINISGNSCRGNDNGIHTSNTTLQCTIANNSLFANTTRGLYLVATTETLVSGNNCKDNGKPIEEDLTSDLNTYVGNDFVGNSAVTPNLVGASNQWRQNNNGGTSTVASAAATALLIYTDYMTITGTTNITSLTGGNWRGRSITLRFDDALTFTDGNNLKLAGSFSTGTNDTITLMGDGTDWYEVARSNN
jgi:parallel beta-helix repeat protein